MKYFLGLLVLGILCQNTLARGLDNPVFDDFERRLVRLESLQFSDSENFEHRMLELEPKLGIHQEERNFFNISKAGKPSESMTFLQRLEKIEKNWEKKLEEKLAKFSSKYENLSERLSDMEKYVKSMLLQKQKSTQDNNKKKDSLNRFQRIGTEYYFIENDKQLSWNQAVRKCKELNAHLVSLPNEEESSALKKAVVPGHRYWTNIGEIYSDDSLESEASDQMDCIELSVTYDLVISDAGCDELKYYICQSNSKDGL